MSDEIFRQIMAIRDTGRVNMSDVPAVQRMACESGFCFIEEHREAYIHFILTGEKSLP